MVCRLIVYGLLVWCIAVMVNAECTSPGCYEGTSTVLNCPPGTTQHNNYCLLDNICPVNTVFKNGFCESINQEPNLQCPAPFILKDGVCLNEPLIEPCSLNSQNCIVDKNVNKTPKTPDCPPPVVTIVTVEKPPVVIQPPKAIIQEPQIIRIVEPPIIVYVTPVNPTRISVIQAPPSNHVNKIDKINIVDNHNNITVPTNINAVNINNIMLSSRAGAVNINNNERSQTRCEGSDACPEDELVTYDEVCCVIMEPRTCVPVGDKIKCYHTRHHKCGAECSESGSDSSVLISYQTYPEKTDTPVEETTPDPLDDEIIVTPKTYPETSPETYPATYPGTYPGHYPYPQYYPDQTNLYQGQINQYPMTYPGQYNPYLTPNQGQPSPIPYPFSAGHNVGNPVLYPGGQNSIPYPGQPYAIPQPSYGGHNMEAPTPYIGHFNPAPYPYQDQSLAVSALYPDQTGQNAYPSQYPAGLSTSFSPSNCVQQQTWPFVNCAQNVKIDCNQCQQTRCHPMCY